jgi:SAM-dependent methyltransferase
VTLFGPVHARYVHPRRTDVLSTHLADLVPRGATVVDVGAGDGLIDKKLLERRPDLEITAVEVLVRPVQHVQVQPFDGTHLPHEDESVDAVLLVDVLHHATDPLGLLEEARRVARATIVVKDQIAEDVLARETLHLMERLANRQHGISIPAQFWNRREWESAFARLDLRVEEWRDRLGLYPFPANLVFERGFHFIARLAV